VPLRLREVSFPNRVALAPVEDWERRLGSGAGVVITPMLAVSEQGRLAPETPLAADLPRAPADVLVMPSIGHAGRRGATRPRRFGVDLPLAADDAWPLVSASPLAYAPWSTVPAELDAQGMTSVIAEFAAGARRARERSYRALELDFSRGGLVASFISPLSNRRADEHGGTLENRLRFPLAVLRAVREEWPVELPLAVAYSASDLAPGGLSLEDALESVRCFGAAGGDIFRVLAGQSGWEWRPEYARMYGAVYSDRVRNECGVPTVAFGQIGTIDEVNTVIAAGRADLCVVTRL
jgi:anthraniloyl-CoA monooxygenase